MHVLTISGRLWPLRPGYTQQIIKVGHLKEEEKLKKIASNLPVVSKRLRLSWNTDAWWREYSASAYRR